MIETVLEMGMGPRPVTPTSILAARLRRLSDGLDAVAGVPEELRADLRVALDLAAGLDPYLDACTTPESPALGELARLTAAEDWAGRPGNRTGLEQEMLSGHVEGQLLQTLVHLSGARRVLEVGMFTGYSALAMAEALPADGEVVACEIDPGVAAFAREAFAGSAAGGRISVEVGPALDTLHRLAALGATFDLVFVDADKAGYAGYLDAILDGGLLTARGVVCVDNTLLQGQAYGAGEVTANGRAVADFNRHVAEDPRVAQVLLPVRDGITLIRRVGADRGRP